jgi:putative toxin-antitoxin system antitoxin component (TIGR02293 family)
MSGIMEAAYLKTWEMMKTLLSKDLSKITAHQINEPETEYLTASHHAGLFFQDAFRVIKLAQQGLPKKYFLFLKQLTGLSEELLAEKLNLSSRNLQRKSEDERLKLDPSEKMLLLTELYLEGYEILGEAVFRSWLSDPCLALGSLVPLEILNTIRGINLVKDEMSRMANGVLS